MSDALKAILADIGDVAIAVSGGVDSMTLAYLAQESGAQAEMYHAISPAVPEAATARVKIARDCRAAAVSTSAAAVYEAVQAAESFVTDGRVAAASRQAARAAERYHCLQGEYAALVAN